MENWFSTFLGKCLFATLKVIKHFWIEIGTFHIKSSLIYPSISIKISIKISKQKKSYELKTWQKIFYKIGVSTSSILEAEISTTTHLNETKYIITCLFYLFYCEIFSDNLYSLRSGTATYSPKDNSWTMRQVDLENIPKPSLSSSQLCFDKICISRSKSLIKTAKHCIENGVYNGKLTINDGALQQKYREIVSKRYLDENKKCKYHAPYTFKG